MEEKIYKYNSDRKTYITTIVYFIILLAAGVFTAYMYAGGYFSAWFISVVVAIIALILISVPRRIVVNKDTLTIECVLEIFEIPTDEIVSIRQIENNECRWMIPICGSPGFFGYFGYYLDLGSLERVQFYATEWRNLVEIVDIYDDRYYISCQRAEELIEQIDSYIIEEE